MTNDLLQRSTRALASSTAETGPDAERLERTLQRIQQARRPAPKHRQMLRTLYWTLAALFMGVGAWANATGRVSWFRSEPAPAPPAESASSTEARRASASAKIAAPVAEETPALTPPPAPELPEAPPAVVRSVPGVRKKAPSAAAPAPAVLAPEVAPPAPTPAPLPPESAIEKVDAAYRDAHRAHFTERDYVRALAGWDRYLQLARADHSLLPEARFNRAIALYRLGRLAAARSALEPFALGEYGGYRRDEARRLIDAIDRN